MLLSLLCALAPQKTVDPASEMGLLSGGATEPLSTGCDGLRDTSSAGLAR